MGSGSLCMPSSYILDAGLHYDGTFHRYQNTRLVYSFDLDNLVGAQVVKATFKVFLNNVEMAPFTTLGNVLVEPVFYESTYTIRQLFEDTDTQVAAVDGQISDAAIGTWKSVDVTDTVRDQIALHRAYAQFRIGHLNIMVTTNTIVSHWESIGGPHKPTLEVTYFRKHP